MLCGAMRNFRNGTREEIPIAVLSIRRLGPVDQARGKSGGTGPNKQAPHSRYRNVLWEQKNVENNLRKT